MERIACAAVRDGRGRRPASVGRSTGLNSAVPRNPASAVEVGGRQQQEVEVEHGPEGDVRVERSRRSAARAEQDDAAALELVDGALEVDQLHHVVVERALVDGEQPVLRPLRRAAAREPVLEVVGGERREAWAMAQSTYPPTGRRERSPGGREGREERGTCREGTAPCSGRPLTRVALLAEGDDLRAFHHGWHADPDDGRGDCLGDLFQRQLVVPVDLEPAVAPGHMDDSEGVASTRPSSIESSMAGRPSHPPVPTRSAGLPAHCSGSPGGGTRTRNARGVQLGGKRPQRIPDLGEARRGLDGDHSLPDDLTEQEVAPSCHVRGLCAPEVEVSQLPDEHEDHAQGREEKRALDAVRAARPSAVAPKRTQSP